jgi:hypothetical protein
MNFLDTLLSSNWLHAMADLPGPTPKKKILNLHSGGGIKVHSTLRPLNGLLCQPRVIMMMKKLVEWLAGETEVLGENLPQCRFVYHKPHMLPGREPGPPRWEASV